MMPLPPRRLPPPEPEKEKLTVDQFLALFHLLPHHASWLASKDSEEYLALVTYLVQRNDKET